MERRMNCDKCNAPIEHGDEREHAGQMLCEDCYMVALSPVKTCDPWAVYAAKSMSGNGSQLSRIQKTILAILKETKGIELKPLAKKLGLKPDEVQREIATLRHMEKLKAAMDGDRKVFRLW
jgi:hypothetical protein